MITENGDAKSIRDLRICFEISDEGVRRAAAIALTRIAANAFGRNVEKCDVKAIGDVSARLEDGDKV